MTFYRFRTLAVFFGLSVGGASAYSLLDPQLDYENHVFGPNTFSELSVISPVDPGVWLPVGGVLYGFSWMESLQGQRLGSKVIHDPRYLRAEASVALSPYYTSFQTLISVRPFRRLEFGAVYQVLGYINSNVEQALPGANQSPNLSQTWRADYIQDRLYGSAMDLDYSQVVGLLTSLDLSYGRMRAGGEYHFYLIDVRTDNKKKSMDYVSMLPVARRDYILQTLLWSRYPLTARWGLALDLEYEQTGFRTKVMGSYDKGSVDQKFVFGGMTVRLGNGSSTLVVEPGYLFRPKNDSNVDVTERLLLRALFQGHWDWDFNQ